MSDPEQMLSVGTKAAREAGVILQSWAKRFTVREKGPSDLVTEADLASQAAIVDAVTTAFPDHDLLGEENLSSVRGQSGYRWVIDPLDGTSNFVHGFPYYAVSIGLELDGKLIAGIIYDPNRDELFTALRGQGARLNGQPIRPSQTASLGDAFLVASLPRRATPAEPAVRRFLTAIPLAESVQRTGSAALNLAYVACGRIDAFWSNSLKPWDMAAGVLIVSEAGGRVTGIDNGEFFLGEPDILATNGTSLHEAVSNMLDVEP